MLFKRGSLACQIGLGAEKKERKKMNWHIYSAYCEMSCNTVSYSPIRCNKAIVGESASERGFSGPGLCLQERQNRDRKNVEGECVSRPTSYTFVCVCVAIGRRIFFCHL